MAGRLVIRSTADTDTPILLPNITITSKTGQTLVLPAGSIKCPNLTVPASGLLACTFRATHNGQHPTPGSVTASVSVPAADGRPASTLQASPVPFDFINAEIVTLGDSAVVSNFFERGDGLVQPYSVVGQQPTASLWIGESREFKFSAWYGGLDSSQCGTTLKVRVEICWGPSCSFLRDRLLSGTSALCTHCARSPGQPVICATTHSTCTLTDTLLSLVPRALHSQMLERAPSVACTLTTCCRL